MYATSVFLSTPLTERLIEYSESRVGSSRRVFAPSTSQSVHKVSYQLLTSRRQTELLDEFSGPADSALSPASLSRPIPSVDAIGFRDACFTWLKDTEMPSTPGSGTRPFKLRIEGELLFRKGRINLIVGPTGSGKTSMLMALLG